MKTKRTLSDFGKLWPAEKKIKAGIDSGNMIVIGNDLPKPDAAKDRQVRASFIRYLALGGCDDCLTHEKGLWVQGALIFGEGDGDDTNGLDLEGCVLTHDLVLDKCLFPDMVLLRGCHGKSFGFSGSEFEQGISAGRLEAKGSVFLRNAIAIGEVRLLGAKLRDDLDCVGATFSSPSGVALSADGLEAKSNVFLRNANVKGAVRMLGAKLGGSLECGGATFSNPSGVALGADGLEAKGAFFLRSGARIEGEISLHNAVVGALIDDPECWPDEKNSIGIDRFRYGAILGPNAPTDAESRLKWLAKIRHMNGFSPQPYEQLAAVLRDMGHREDARVVMIEKERLQRQAQNPPWWRRVWDRVMRVSAGYGYRPSLSIYWLLGLWLAGALVFGVADLSGSLKPNSDRVWDQKEWKGCEGAAPSQKWCYLVSDVGEGYPIFNPFIYSADTLLPIVDLEMQGAWIPDERHGWVGVGARLYMWLHIALGWFFSLLAVAGFSGLIKPE